MSIAAKHLSKLVATTAGVLLSSTASAALIQEAVNHGTVIHPATLAQVDTSGTFAFGINFGAAANTTTTIGDVTFIGNGTANTPFALGGGYSVTMTTTNNTGWGTATQTAATGDASWDAVLNARRFKNGTGGSSTITLDGLVVGQDYKMQLLLYRVGGSGSTQGMGSAASIDFDQTANPDYVGFVEESQQLVVWGLDFTATSSTGIISVAPTTWNVDAVQETLDTAANNIYSIGTGNPHPEGNNVRRGDRIEGLVGLTLEVIVDETPVVPEPMTAGLAAIGALGLLARRRR